MDLITFICLLFGLQAIYWFVGRRASKNIKTSEDYFLAGKTTHFFPLTMTFLAAQVGGGLVLGSAEEAYKYGWPVILYPFGAACGLMLLGAGIGRKLAQFPVTTVAQIFEIVYGSHILKKMASALSVITLFIILVAQIIASNKFLASIGFDNSLLFVVFWAIVIIYTAQGGLKAVIATDIMQAAFFSLVFFCCLFFALYFHPLVKVHTSAVEMFSIDSSKMYGWLLMPMLFSVIGQDMAQKCFAGSSPRVVQSASFLAGVCTLVVCTIPIFFGILAKTQGIQVAFGTSILMAAIEKFTHPFLTALVGCAILAAIISTATSLISAISSNLSNDFRIFQGKKDLHTIQWVAAGISLLAIFFSFFFDNVIDLLIQSFELSVSCLFIPLIFGLFKKKGPFMSGLLAMIFGAMGFCLFRIYPLEFPQEVANIILSLIGYYLGEMIANPEAKKAGNL